jgi:hypothetical protein
MIQMVLLTADTDMNFGTVATGIDELRDVVVYDTDSASSAHGFLWWPGP